MNTTVRFVSLASVLVLANCTGATDPADANVFDNFVNTQRGGVYDQQIAARNAEAAALRINNRNTQSRINTLDRQSRSNADTIAALRSEVASVRAEIASARSRLGSGSPEAAQLASLDRQALSVQRDVESGGDASVARRELSQIRATVRQISS